jgi:hypothetical protein
MKIDFEVETQYGKFCDALYFDEMPEESVVEAMKQERVNNWIAIVSAPPVSDYIMVDGVQYEKVVMDDQVILKPVGV